MRCIVLPEPLSCAAASLDPTSRAARGLGFRPQAVGVGASGPTSPHTSLFGVPPPGSLFGSPPRLTAGGGPSPFALAQDAIAAATGHVCVGVCLSAARDEKAGPSLAEDRAFACGVCGVAFSTWRSTRVHCVYAHDQWCHAVNAQDAEQSVMRQRSMPCGALFSFSCLRRTPGI